MQQAKLDNRGQSSRDKRVIHGIMKDKIKEAKKYPKDALCIWFLQPTNNFQALNFCNKFRPSGKPRNSDMVFINVKVLFREMLAICRKEMGLSETFWFHKPYSMGQSNDKFLMKEQEKLLFAAK